MTSLASEFFVMVLCLYFTPDSQKEIRVDAIDRTGYVDSLIVKRSKEDFSVYDEMNGKLEQYMEIRRVKGKKHVYDCKDIRDKKETIDLSKWIVAFESVDRESERITLNLKAGGKVRIIRSGAVLYVTPPGKRTYVVQLQPGRVRPKGKATEISH